MPTEFGDQIATALKRNASNINSYVWKGEKTQDSTGKIVQKELKLMDVSPEELTKFYNHCQTMLFNTDKRNPGRIVLLGIISDQINRCGVELFYRDSIEKGSSRFTIVEALKKAVSQLNLSTEQYEALKLGDLMQVAPEFAVLPYKLVIEGGIKHLGKFDRKHITLTFIVKQGVWFSPEEKEEYDSLSTEARVKIDAVKKNLKIPEYCRLMFNDVTGLTVKELKTVLSLKIKKYDEMTTGQLQILRNKLLFSLEDEVGRHIDQWNTRVKQIKKVAEARKIEL